MSERGPRGQNAAKIMSSFNNQHETNTSGHEHQHGSRRRQRSMFDPDNSKEATNTTQLELRIKTSQKFTLRSASRFKRAFKRHCLVVLFAWLFMNTDPGYSQRVIASMVALRMLKNVLAKGAHTDQQSALSSRLTGRTGIGGLFSGGGGDSNAIERAGGMNAVEAIALIHALNGGRQATQAGDQHVDLSGLIQSQKPPSLLRQHAAAAAATTTALAPRQQLEANNLMQRQLAPAPPIVAVLAAVAAFLAAVASGAAPLVAVAAAVAALFAALLVAILVVIAPAAAKKQAPIIKKLVIKKTVLPFVIPIPIKKKEKEIVYIPKPVHYHHKEKEHYQHHHEEYKHKHKYKYKKHKKADYADGDDRNEPDVGTNHDDLALDAPSQLQVPPVALADMHDGQNMDKIDSLLSEQDRIQSMMDEVVERQHGNLD